MLSACHVSGSEGRRRGDSLRNLFVPQLQSDERNSKNHWFLAAFFPPFLPLLEEMGPPEAQRESVQRAAAAKSDPRSEVRCPPFEKKNERAVEDDADPCKKHIALQKKGSRALGRGIPVTINRCPA